MYSVENVRGFFDRHHIKYDEKSKTWFNVYFTPFKGKEKGKHYKFGDITMIVDRDDMWDGYYLTTKDFYKVLDWDLDYQDSLITTMQYMEYKIILLYLIPRKNRETLIGNLPKELLTIIYEYIILDGIKSFGLRKTKDIKRIKS